VADDVRLRFVADLQQLRQGLEAGGVSASEAKARVAELTKVYSWMEKAAKKAQKEAQVTGKQLEGAMRSVEGAGRAIGGPVGAAIGLLGDLEASATGLAATVGSTLGIAAGAAAAAVIGLGAASVGAFTAMDSLAESTRTAIERLEQITGPEQAARGAAEAVEAWDQATLRLEATTAALTTQLGADLLPTAARVLESVLEVADAFRWLEEGATSLISRTDRLRLAFGFMTGGASVVIEQINRLRDTLTPTSEALVDMADSSERLAAQSIEVAALQRKRAEADRLLADEQRYLEKRTREREAAQRAAAAAAERVAGASDKLATITRDLTMAVEARAAGESDASAAIELGYQRQLDAIAELEETSGRRDLADAARAAASQQREIELTDLAAQESAKRAAYVEQVAAAAYAAEEVRREAARETSRQLEAIEAERRQTTNEATAAAAEGFVELADWALEQQIAAAESGGESQKKAALRAWKVRQTLAIASATFDFAAAYMGLLAAYAPLGFGAPIAAAATAVPPYALALAKIASAPPPSFALGGLVEADHQIAAVAPGEAVLTRRATQALGRDTIERMNAGVDGGQPAALVMRYRHRDLSTVLADHLRLDTPLARALDGAKKPGRRR
jgi:hypothetical protein